MNLLRHLNDVDKKTVILVTHDPSHLRHAHRIFYLRDGEITGTKTNTEEERNQAPIPLSISPAEIASHAQEHWERTRKPGDSKAPEGEKDRADMLKAEQILLETFTGLTMEEIGTLEQKIFGFLKNGHQDRQTVLQFLERPAHLGGIGMQKDTAEDVSHDIHRMMVEVRRLRTVQSVAPAERTHEIRMFTSHDIHLANVKAARNMDEAIRGRLDGKLTRSGVQKFLNREIEDGGAGIGIFTARSVSKTIESLIDVVPSAPASNLEQSPAAAVPVLEPQPAPPSPSESTPSEPT